MSSILRTLFAAVAIIASSAISNAEDFRIWTDSTGRFRTEAQLLGFKDGQVELKKRDGSVIKIPIEKLAADDQEFVHTQASDGDKPAKPVVPEVPPASHKPAEALDTPIGSVVSAHFSDTATMYFYDAGSVIPGIKTREPFLVVVFTTDEKQFGPWNAGDYTITDDKGVKHAANMIDVGGDGYWCSAQGGKPATQIEKLTRKIEKLTRKEGDTSTCFVQFLGVNPQAGELTIAFKQKQIKMPRVK